MIGFLEEQAVECQMLNMQVTKDEYGGYTQYPRRWVDGIKFKAAIGFSASTENAIAEQQGVTSLYEVATDRALVLQYHDVFRRLSDGKIFRVTTDGDDNPTPTSSAIDSRIVRAEEWSLPND